MILNKLFGQGTVVCGSGIWVTRLLLNDIDWMYFPYSYLLIDKMKSFISGEDDIQCYH